MKERIQELAEQALSTDEALMTLELILRDGIEHGNWPLNKNCEDGLEAITALREALAEPDIEEMTLTQIAARHEQAEQEPVAWTYTRKGIYDKLTELGASITKSCCNVPDKRCGADEWVLQTVQIELLLDALPAPVRTKDLTDDEIMKAWNESDDMTLPDFARAVIAADRELNK